MEPTHQRQGLGAALLRPILARADADRIPCYLETFAEENVPFYTRHGFAVVTAGIEPTGGVSFWTMRREPLSGRSATD